MKNKTVSAILSASLIVSVLTGCAPVKETNAETEPPVVWAEEKGVVTTDKREFEMPGFPYYMTEDRSDHCTEYYPISADMSYKFRSVDVSEPDKYGQVTYTVKYDYEIEVSVNDEETEKADAAGFTKVNVLVLFFNVVDANSGVVAKRFESHQTHRSLALTEIDWGGSKYTVGWSLSHENTWDDWVTTENEDGTSISTITFHRNVTQTIVAPEGYDGLYLFIDKNGDTKYDEQRFEEIPAHQWGEYESDLSDYYFVKLTDLV